MTVTMPTEERNEDRALVVATRGGDDAAREALGRRVGRAAYVFALQLTGDRDAAMDVAQDGVVRFFRNLDRFDEDRPLEPWLYQIVRNRVRDLARSEGRRRVESLDALLQVGPPTAALRSDPATVDVERAELQRRIWAAVAELSDDHREIFVLRDHHGLSYREIAQALSIPEGTVMSRLHGARTRLRSLLAAERDPDEPNTTERGDR
ncbi:MAG: RNA polymerase sigma factor [Actinomycetota bacterium]